MANRINTMIVTLLMMNIKKVNNTVDILYFVFA